jgi:sugar lactone lactonase YvrE
MELQTGMINYDGLKNMQSLPFAEELKPKVYIKKREIKMKRLIATQLLALLGLMLTSYNIKAQSTMVGFDSDQWVIVNAQQQEFLGRKSLMGFAYLKDVEFENGVIEVDMAVQRMRSYPGIVFRMKSQTDYERVYLRPHRAGLYPDAIQYVASFNGIDSWQLYNGEGMTASVVLPYEEWFHVKIEIQGTQARVFINNSEQAALHIDDLQHGLSKGTIGLNGPTDGSAYFSNFSYRIDNTLDFTKPYLKEMPPGMIDNWQISQVFKANELDLNKTPIELNIDTIRWQSFTPTRSGIVDISRYYARRGNAPDLVYARTFLESSGDTLVEFSFGYSDIISIFLNGNKLFSASSAYQQRDPSFLGIIGLNDYLTLPLQKGKNELLISLIEVSGGWGFIFQDANAIFQDKRLTKVWEIPYKFKYPESVVYDKKRDALYVSNYFNNRDEFISKIKPDGKIEKLDWVQGVLQPSGMCIYDDKLFVVCRKELVEIDIESGSIKNKFPFTQARFPNDIDADKNGNLYITDSQADAIYKFRDGEFETWIQGGPVCQPNGILVDDNELLVGTSRDGCIKRIDLVSKTTDTLACIGEGAIMDGLRSDGNGNYLISDNNGRIFLVTQTGEKTKLLDTTVPQRLCADFEYIIEKNLLVVPTFYDNRIMTYTLK